MATEKKIAEFKKYINEGNTFKKGSIVLGGAMLDGEPVSDSKVKIPLKTLNRHGLIAGATGTGKTKTLQIMAEQLSLNGVPSVLMDIKGDLSGLAQPGSSNDHIVWRHGAIGEEYIPRALPIELFSISNEPGTRMRSTISEFGPVLLSKILGLNDTQGGIVTIMFKYCDDNQLPLLDLKDLRKTLQYLNSEGKKEIEAEYGKISSVSISTIMRKVVELEQQGAELFLGERSFEVNDFLLKDNEGNGKISIIRLADIQNKPKLFSTFMLSLLAEIYQTFPEAGDNDKPKLCLFIDEAHLVFEEASDELLDQIEVIIKLIRSKGVGIFFCTQTPTDIPNDVLGQLGLKIQHALRAFTAKDRKSIKQTAENYPLTDYYETDEIITKLGIGEALVTALNEKGIPTPLAATLLRAPITRMGVLTDSEIKDVVNNSELGDKYNKTVDRESAYEILDQKIKRAQAEEHQEELRKEQDKLEKERRKIRERESKKRSTRTRKRSVGRPRKSATDKFIDKAGTTLVRELTRGLLGILGLK